MQYATHTSRMINDECGVFGVWAPEQDVAQMTYFGLYALQHRGQQSAGIATSDGSSILVYKDLGLVSQVFNDQNLSVLRGHMALGHVRYSTTGADVWENAQPTIGNSPDGGTMALAHNGNLTNTDKLRSWVDSLRSSSGDHARGASTDTAVLTALFGASQELCPHPTEADSGYIPPMVRAALRILPHAVGAFSLVFMDENTLCAARDRHGIRPLVLGHLERGWCVTSETAALDIIGATYVRDIEPGEVISISSDGIQSFRFAQATPHGCIFEYVYLARPDTKIAGHSMIHARTKMGAALARTHPVDADLVIATPDSGTPAAIGYSQESGIVFSQGIVKNAYVGRTFIQPSQMMRKRGIRLKLNPIKEVIEGKRLVVVDDSIVRGNTQRAVVKMLREAGAKEVHVRISSPPVKWPCFFGIDFPTRAELISAAMDVEEVRRSIDADSLGFLSVDDMVQTTAQARDHLCTACFTGKYPMPIPAGTPVPGSPGMVTYAPAAGEDTSVHPATHQEGIAFFDDKHFERRDTDSHKNRHKSTTVLPSVQLQEPDCEREPKGGYSECDDHAPLGTLQSQDSNDDQDLVHNSSSIKRKALT